MDVSSKKRASCTKIAFSMLLLAVVCISAMVFVNTSEDTEGADPFLFNGLYYDFVGEDDFLTVVGYDETALPKEEIIVRQTLTFDWGEYDVKAIGKGAFQGYEELKSISSLSVVTIRDNAFDGCINLSTVSMGNLTSIGMEAFSNCEKLETVVLSDVTSIGERAFQKCVGLGTITLTDVGTIGSQAFQECTGTIEVTLTDVGSIGSMAFQNSGVKTLEITNNDDPVTIGSLAFQNCAGLETITLTGVKTIGEQAFQKCKGIETITLTNVETISNQAFLECTGAIDITLKNVDSIGLMAFQKCKGIKTITLTNVMSIGERAFQECTGTIEVTLTDVDSIGLMAFQSSGVKTLEITNNDDLVTIGEQAFHKCVGLKTITLTDVGTIGEQAFQECTSLEIVEMTNINSIGKSMFRDCTSLAYVSMPNNVASIGDYAFDGCSGLTSLTISGREEGNGDVLGTYFKDATWALPGSNPITTLIIDTNDEIDIGSVKIVEDNTLKITSQSESVIGANNNVIFSGNTVTGGNRAGNSYIGTSGQWIGGDVFVSATATPDIGGSVTGETKYTAGDNASLEAVPKEGYEFVEWRDSSGEGIHDSSTYNLRIKKDTELSAAFKLKEYQLVLSAEPSGKGTLRGEGTYEHGTNVEVTAIPNEGYNFVEWRDGEKTLSTDPSYSFNIEGNTTLTAVFDIITITLSARADPSHQGEVKGTGMYEYGTTVKVSAIPYDGYRFVSWSDGNTNAERSIKLTTNVLLIAYFVEDIPNMCTVTIIIEGNGKVFGMGTVEKGEIITLNAVPDNGHSFQGWSHTTYTGTTISLSVESNMVITATFSATDTGIGGSSNSLIDTTTAIVIILIIVIVFGSIVVISLVRGRRSV